MSPYFIGLSIHWTYSVTFHPYPNGCAWTVKRVDARCLKEHSTKASRHYLAETMLRSGLSSQRIRELIGLFDIHRTTNGAFVLDERREHESFGLDKVQSVAVSVIFEIGDAPALVDPHTMGR